MHDKTAEPFEEPVTQLITGYKLTAARNLETGTGMETPVVVVQLEILDEGASPPKRFQSNL